MLLLTFRDFFELDYDGKSDRRNSYDTASYALTIERYEARDEARKKFLKDEQLKKLEEKNNKENEEIGDSEYEDFQDALKVDERKQMDFAKVEKCVWTTGGGSTGTVSGSNDQTTKFWFRNRPGDSARDKSDMGQQGLGDQNAGFGRTPGNYPGPEPPSAPGAFTAGLLRNEGTIPGVGAAMPLSIPGVDSPSQGEHKTFMPGSMPIGEVAYYRLKNGQ